MKCENIYVTGLGYIGLPTAAMFASCRASVIGVEVSPDAQVMEEGKAVKILRLWTHYE